MVENLHPVYYNISIQELYKCKEDKQWPRQQKTL